MSVSIYYKFQSKEDLKSSGVLSTIENIWNDKFDGNPYESWTWYEPEFNNGLYTYEGATKLPPPFQPGKRYIATATAVLSTIRSNIGGSNWNVHIDGQELKWNEEHQDYGV